MATISTPLAQGLSIGAVNAPTISLTSAAPSGGSSGNPTSIIDQAGSAASSLQFPLDLPKFYTTIRYSSYSRQTPSSVGGLSPLGVIRLPLPVKLQDVHPENYTELEIGAIGGAIGNLGGGMIGAATGSLFSSLDNLVPPIATGAFGVSLNEFVTILFRAPAYKQPVLSFHLAPRSYEESSAIRLILNKLNNAMSPGTTAAGTLFTFPNIFEVAYQPNPGWLYKFKPAVLEQMTVDYDGGGHVAFYRDQGGQASGANSPPESINITMQFREIEYWLNGDFKDTNNPYDGTAR